MKQVEQHILYYLKIYDLVRYINRGKVIILMYHRFSEKKEPFKIDKETFENQILFLKKYFNIISMDQYIDFVINGNYKGHKYPIILTIDDGYRDNYEIAYPILKKYNIPACIYLVTDFISHNIWLWGNKIKYITLNTKVKEFDFPVYGNNYYFNVSDFQHWHKAILNIFNYCRTLSDEDKDKYINDLLHYLKVDLPEHTSNDYLPLTWTQIKEMSQYGISFGSHTRSHPILTRINSDKIIMELSESKKEIENILDINVKHFCYPNGKLEDYNNYIISVLKELSYVSSVTTIPGFNIIKNQNIYDLKRVVVSTGDNIYLTHVLSRHLLPL